MPNGGSPPIGNWYGVTPTSYIAGLIDRFTNCTGAGLLSSGTDPCVKTNVSTGSGFSSIGSITSNTDANIRLNGATVDGSGNLTANGLRVPATSACATVTLSSYAGTLATSGNQNTCGTVALSHSSTTTVNISGLTSGAYFNLELTQDSTGGNTLTLGTGCTWLQGGNAGFTGVTTPALTAAASGTNMLAAFYDGTNCLYNVR